ncbi:MAG: hypothetical protein GY786_15905, partial [Proteobacteria bacterium]|nr:hypothetical protein [Pseudomonadota bacterium]
EYRTSFRRLSYDPTGETVILTDTIYLVQKPKSENFLSSFIDSLLGGTSDSSNALKYVDEKMASFRWEHDSTALIIGFRQPSDSAVKNGTYDGGVIICGTAQSGKTNYLPEPILWLPYPGKKGDASDSTVQFVAVSILEEVNNPMLDETGKLSSTYCYREISGDKQIFSWYSVGYTLLAKLEYQNGVRIRSVFRI